VRERRGVRVEDFMMRGWNKVFEEIGAKIKGGGGGGGLEKK
jgi:hypothetical protein